MCMSYVQRKRLLIAEFCVARNLRISFKRAGSTFAEEALRLPTQHRLLRLRQELGMLCDVVPRHCDDISMREGVNLQTSGPELMLDGFNRLLLR